MSVSGGTNYSHRLVYLAIITKDKTLTHFGAFKISRFNLVIFTRAELMDPSLLPSLLCYLDLS